MTMLSVGEQGVAEAMAPETALFAGDGGAASEAALSRPEALLLSTKENRVLIADTGNGLVRSASLATGLMSTIAGSVTSSTPPTSTPVLATDVQLTRPVGLSRQADDLYVADSGDGPAEGKIVRVDLGANPPTAELLFDANSGFRRVESPAGIASHTFSSGARWLFVTDLVG